MQLIFQIGVHVCHMHFRLRTRIFWKKRFQKLFITFYFSKHFIKILKLFTSTIHNHICSSNQLRAIATFFALYSTGLGTWKFFGGAVIKNNIIAIMLMKWMTHLIFLLPTAFVHFIVFFLLKWYQNDDNASLEYLLIDKQAPFLFPNDWFFTSHWNFIVTMDWSVIENPEPNLIIHELSAFMLYQ